MANNAWHVCSELLRVPNPNPRSRTPNLLLSNLSFPATNKVSVIDHVGEHYGTVTAKNLGHNLSNDLVTLQTQNSRDEERALRAHRLWEERGCPIGSPEEDWFRADEEIRSEQAVRDEAVRARNKRVRAPRSAPGAGSPPPFADHSGQL